MAKDTSKSFRKEGKNLLLATAMAVAILVGIGYTGAEDWNEAQLKKKIDKLGKTCPDPDKSPVTGDALTALKAVVEIQSAGGAVTIADLAAAEEADDEEDDEEDDDDSEDEDDDESEDDESEEDEDGDEEESDEEEADEADEEDEEEEAPAPAKKDKKKDKKKAAAAEEEAPAKSEKKKDKKSEKKADKGEKKGGIVKVGIIDGIVDILKGTKSAKGALSKKEILAALALKFPDRNEENMKATIGVQVPYNLRKKGMAIEKTEDGKFYVPGEAKKSKPAAEEAPAKSEKKKDKPAAAAEEAPAKSDKKKKKSAK